VSIFIWDSKTEQKRCLLKFKSHIIAKTVQSQFDLLPFEAIRFGMPNLKSTISQQLNTFHTSAHTDAHSHNCVSFASSTSDIQYHSGAITIGEHKWTSVAFNGQTRIGLRPRPEALLPLPHSCRRTMRHSDSEPELTIPEEGLWGLGIGDGWGGGWERGQPDLSLRSKPNAPQKLGPKLFF